jgi:small subunit ribosomal protein S16
MVKIRLTRTGRKNAPSYRIIAIDSRAKRDGKYLERLGFFNPSENPDNVVFNKERYDYWVSVGAEATDAVKKLVSGSYKYKAYGKKAKAAEEAAAKKAEEAPAEAQA